MYQLVYGVITKNPPSPPSWTKGSGQPCDQVPRISYIIQSTHKPLWKKPRIRSPVEARTSQPTIHHMH